MPSFFRFIITACVVLVFATSVHAQEARSFDFEAFDATALRAESVVKTAEASSNALEALRSTMAQLRSDALDEQDARGNAAKEVRDQISSLGAAPAEGEQEDPEIAARRAELTEELEIAPLVREQM